MRDDDLLVATEIYLTTVEVGPAAEVDDGRVGPRRDTRGSSRRYVPWSCARRPPRRKPP